MTTSPDLQSRLAQAANLGNLDECRRLLTAGADPAFADADKFTRCSSSCPDFVILTKGDRLGPCAFPAVR
jgi:hypothetical protein